MAWLLNEDGVADGHGRAKREVDAAAHAGGTHRAAAAGPALSHVANERAAGHEGRRDDDQGDTAPFADAAGLPAAPAPPTA